MVLWRLIVKEARFGRGGFIRMTLKTRAQSQLTDQVRNVVQEMIFSRLARWAAVGVLWVI